MSFASWYESPWHHPGLAFIATLLVFLISPWLPGLSGPRRRWLLGLQLLAAVDALWTGPFSPVSGWPAGSTAATVLFVILGDARYFFLVQDPTLSSPQRRTYLGRALLLCTGFSLFSYLLSRAWPAGQQSSRVLFLTYEVLFIALLVSVQRFLPPSADPRIRRAVRLLTGFELVQYGLWVAADLWILFGGAAADLGYALRLLPNALYYGGFAAFAAAYGILPNQAREPASKAVDLDETRSLAV